jgi:two-component system response regulator FixJ
MAKRRVYVVDDEEPIRRSASLLLKVAGLDPEAFEAGQALLDVVDALVPGAILLDMRMPGLDGIEVQRALRERGSPHPVVIMTGHGDLNAAVTALESGAVAFVEKPFSKAGLIEMLDLAFLKLEDPEGFSARSRDAQARIAALGTVELEVLAGLTRGRSSEEIGTELSLGVREVEVRRARIFDQLGVDGVTGALNVAFAAKCRNG